MNAPMRTSGTKQATNLFNYFAILIVLAGIGLFYTLHINVWFKWAIVLVSVIGGISIFYWISPTGLKLHGYVKDSWREVGKVVWPTRKEAMQFTWIVFLFVLVLGLFLWVIDSSLAWLFYNVILGKGNS